MRQKLIRLTHTVPTNYLTQKQPVRSAIDHLTTRTLTHPPPPHSPRGERLRMRNPPADLPPPPQPAAASSIE